MTAPVTAPPSCVVTVNGQVFNDGTDNDSAMILTNLRINWGRPNTIDQPSPSTCSFTVLDPAAAPTYRTDLHVGDPVLITAEATVYPDPTVNQVTNPGWESTAIGGQSGAALVRNAGPSLVVGVPAKTGARAARIAPLDSATAGGAVQVAYGCRPINPADPSAWDTVPLTVAGQTWKYGISIRLPDPAVGTTRPGITIRPCLFTAATGAPGTVTILDGTADKVGAVDGNRYQSYAGTVVPPPGGWLGVLVEMWPTGARISDVPAAGTWSALPAALTWADVDAIRADDLVIMAPAAGALRRAVPFAGRITDLVAQFDQGTTRVQVTCADQLAELNNRLVGTAPWSAGRLADRFSGILYDAGVSINTVIDNGVADLVVTRRDVDQQPAGALLGELAKTSDSVLWSAASATTGPVLILASMGARASSYRLHLSSTDAKLHVVISPPPASMILPACDLSLDPIRWHQDQADVITRATVTYQVQTTPVTQASVTVIDTAREASIGARRLSTSTQLTNSADATTLATNLIARLGPLDGWRVDSLTWDIDAGDPLDAAAIDRAMTLLDGTSRLGLPVLIDDLPDWSPIADTQNALLFVEGGTYTHRDGAWTIALTVSGSAGTGSAGSFPWTAPPSWAHWDSLADDVTWAGLTGVGWGG